MFPRAATLKRTPISCACARPRKIIHEYSKMIAVTSNNLRAINLINLSCNSQDGCVYDNEASRYFLIIFLITPLLQSHASAKRPEVRGPEFESRPVPPKNFSSRTFVSDACLRFVDCQFHRAIVIRLLLKSIETPENVKERRRLRKPSLASRFYAEA